jgi:hypothetical protein
MGETGLPATDNPDVDVEPEELTGLPEEAEPEEAQETVKYVFWDGPVYTSRGLTVEDFATIGAEAESDIWWNRDNGWRVRRDRLPLSDEQLAWLLGREPRFSVREVPAD